MDYTYNRQQNPGVNSDLQRFSMSIGSNIQKISQNVKSMKQLVNQLGTDQDNPQLRAQLHQIQHYTGRLAKDTKIEIQSFQNHSVPAGQDQRTWRLQADRLTKDFAQSLNDFQDVQRLEASKEKEALKEARAQTDANFFESSGGGSMLLDLSQNKTQRSTQVQLQIEQEELASLQERESQIRQLESDIFDVNQIFKDLATMVHEQGELVDSIEANVEVASANVSQGAVQLGQARISQNKARRKKLCLIVSSVVIISIILAIIIITAKN